ncbi:MAG TPA: antitoxin Xre-like helix-turn-helix domain-containing protein [Chitinophagaceae bacterium]|nr:antitoxin Xre-like helix-turn-helix domain-containing protein [Chitinophagaceae bacterium]
MINNIPATNKTSVKSKFRGVTPDNAFALVMYARKGLKPKVFYDFAAAINMTEKRLAGIINLSARTLSNYQAQQKTLEPIYSEHLLKLIALYEKGEAIFGNIDEFNYWLKKPLWNTEETPLDWLETPGGVDIIAEEIDRLAYAYPI